MVFHFMAQARMQQILCVVLDWSRWGILIFMKAKDIDNMKPKRHADLLPKAVMSIGTKM